MQNLQTTGSKTFFERGSLFFAKMRNDQKAICPGTKGEEKE